MKIITRGNGLKKYGTKIGIMTIDFRPNINDTFWLKLDTASGEQQYIIELDDLELAKIAAISLKDKEIIKICKRNGWLEGLKNV